MWQVHLPHWRERGSLAPWPLTRGRTIPTASQAAGPPRPLSPLGHLHPACGLDPQVRPGDPAVLSQLYAAASKSASRPAPDVGSTSVRTRWEAIRTSRPAPSPGSVQSARELRALPHAAESSLRVQAQREPRQASWCTTGLLKNAAFPNFLCSRVMSVLFYQTELVCCLCTRCVKGVPADPQQRPRVPRDSAVKAPL